MPHNSSPFAVQLRQILLVDDITRHAIGKFRSSSLPGHLLHITLSGKVRQMAEGRHEVFGENSAVWYHNNEPIQGEILTAPWRFITIHFDAPHLPPPPDHQRVVPANPTVKRLGLSLLSRWNDSAQPPLKNELLMTRDLIDILIELRGEEFSCNIDEPLYPTNAREIWWLTEKRIREQLDQPLTLKSIAKLTGLSERTTIRACKAATGSPPATRVRELRIAHAANLLQHSTMTITDIAAAVGFERVQEFSRDFKKRTGLTPSAARTASPEYLARR